MFSSFLHLQIVRLGGDQIVGCVAFAFGFLWQLRLKCEHHSDIVGKEVGKTWVMNIIRALGDPTYGIRASKRGQTIQMERMAAVRKPPNLAVSNTASGMGNWNVTGYTPK